MTDIFGDGKRFTAHVPDRPADARFTVDGVDITQAVAEATVQIFAGEPGSNATVILRFADIYQPATDIRRAVVQLAADQVALLEASGWHAPAIAHAAAEVVRVGQAWMAGTALTVDLQMALEQFEAVESSG